MLAGSKLTLRLGAFSSSSVRRSSRAGHWPGWQARVRSRAEARHHLRVGTGLAGAPGLMIASIPSLGDRPLPTFGRPPRRYLAPDCRWEGASMAGFAAGIGVPGPVTFPAGWQAG